MRLEWPALLVSAAVVLATAACRSPTQITFDITTNVDCSEITDTSLTSGPLAALTDGRPATAVAHGCASTGTIGSVVVVPSGGDTDLVAVEIVTGIGVEPDQCGPNTKCITAKRALRFIPNTPLVVNVNMWTLCEGVVCNGDQTCNQGQCVSALIPDPTECEGNGCSGDVLAPVDGGAPDARPDATLPPDASVNGSVDGAVDGSVNATDATLPGDAAADADAASPTDATTDATLPAFTYAPPFIELGLVASCALMPDGTVQCWGYNAQQGSLGENASEDASVYTPAPVQGLANVVSLAVGESSTCVVLDGGGLVECWGGGGEGELGNNTTINQNVPAPVLGNGVTVGGPFGGMAMGSVVEGYNHTCAVATDRVTLWCWGYYGVQGDGPPFPTDAGMLDAGVVEMSAGNAMTCARTTDKAVWCWGSNFQWALGGAVADAAAIYVPPQLVPVPAAIQVAVARTGGCVVTTANDLYCWGDNTFTQLGYLDGAVDFPSPVLIPFFQTHVRKVGCGERHTCVLLDDAGVACWGNDELGQLGTPVTTAEGKASFLPISVPNLGPAKDLYVHYESSCAKLVDGGIACWGNDEYGQLGVGEVAVEDGGEPYGAAPLGLQ